MKKLFKNLMPMLLLVAGLGISPNAWAWEFNYPTIYFYTTSSDTWNQAMFFMYYKGGKDGKEASQGYNMTRVPNTKLWYTLCGDDRGGSLSGFVYGIAATADWGWEEGSKWDSRWGHACSNYSHTGTSQTNLPYGTYYMSSTGSDNLSVSSDPVPTYTAKIKIKKSENGGSSYTTLASGTWPATIYMKGTTWSGTDGQTKQTDFNTNSGSEASYSTIPISGEVVMSLVDNTTNAAYEFKGWGTGDSPTDVNTSKTYNISANTTYYAFFARKQFVATFDVHSSGNGSLGAKENGSTTIYSGGKFNYGSSITFTATPNSGYVVEGWYSDASCSKAIAGAGTSTTYTPTNLTSAVSVYVKFKTQEYSVTFGVGTDYTSFGSVKASVNDGEAKDAGSYSIGASSKVVFTATPATGYEVEGWYSNADCTSAKLQTGGNSYTIASLAKVETVYVKFKAKQFTITYKDQGDKTFSGTHDTGYPTKHTYDQTTTLKSATKTGYEFQGWFNNAECTGEAISTIGGTDYTDNFTLYAKWQINTYNISYPASPAHYTITENTTSGDYNAPASFTATPEDGYRLVVTATKAGGGSVTLNQDIYDYSFTIPADDVTISVTAYPYRMSQPNQDTQSNTLVDFTDGVYQVSLNENTWYTFRLYNEGYTNKNSHYMGSQNSWDVEENLVDGEVTMHENAAAFYLCTGVAGTYTFTIKNSANNKPVLSITYPNVSTITIKHQSSDDDVLQFTQVGSTNIWRSDVVTLEQNKTYDTEFYWEGAFRGNTGTMTYSNHTGWHMQHYNDLGKTFANMQLQTRDKSHNAGNYYFEFNTENHYLTAVYPSYFRSNGDGIGWDNSHPLTFDENGIAVFEFEATRAYKGDGILEVKVVDEGQYYTLNQTVTTSASNLQFVADPDENTAAFKVQIVEEMLGKYTFTYNKKTHQMSVNYPDTEQFEITYTDAEGTKTIKAGPNGGRGISAANKPGYRFTGWVISPDNTYLTVADNDLSRQTTTVYGKKDGGSLTATYSNDEFIYFKNIPGWSNVNVYFYSEDYFDPNNGSGCLADKDANKRKAYGWAMTHIPNTDIWYLDYKGMDRKPNVNIVAFSDHLQNNYQWFNECQVAYRKDFSTCTPMYMPVNWIHERLCGGKTAYYEQGCWMKFDSQESGYEVKLYDVITGSGTALASVDLTAEGAGGYVFTGTININFEKPEGYNYGFKIKNKCNETYFGNNGTMTSTNCTNWEFNSASNMQNCGLTTTTKGNYTFTISFDGGIMHVSVEYPVSNGDYRVVYKEGANEPIWNGFYYKQSATDRKDMASFFITNGVNATVELQRGTNVSADPAVWEKVAEINTSSLTTGVYNFEVSQTNAGANATIENKGIYSGDFYIRTDGVDGGWKAYATNSDNKMTGYGSLLDAGVTYNNFQYNYYKTKWIDNGKNVKFCIANDYSKNISSEFTTDATLGGDAQTLPQEANVRFMWNSTNNTLSRAYISGSTDITKRFLVLIGDEKMFDKNGNPLDITGLNPNEINFADNNNWVYQADIKAQPGCAVKLTAAYNSNVQYFIGAAGEETGSRKTIISGSATEKQYTMRVVYDFKTNLLIAGWVPDGTTISEKIELGGDMLITRTHQDDAQQIIFGTGGSIEQIHHVYGVLSIKKDTMLGNGIGDKAYTTIATNADYSRTMYWISFPFDVNISEIFGVDGYGQKWIMQRYNGEKRAKIGWFKGDGTETFWEFMDASETLNAYEGYLFLIDANYFNTEGADVWKNSATEANFYFPSASGNIGIINKSSDTIEVLAHECKIDRNFEVTDSGGSTTTMNHKITDSHWNVIGVPAFQNASGSVVPSDNNFKAFYEWNSTTNGYNVRATADSYEFKTMHAYMTQFYGTIEWENVSVVTTNSAPYRYTDEKNYMIELFFNGNGAEDHTYINLADEASTDFVLNEDMMKIDNAGFPNIYSFAGNYNVAYNETKKDNQTVMLGVSAPKDGNYTFAMPKDFSGTAKLVDLVEGITTDLNVANYSVDLNKGTYNNRFQLVLEVEAKTPTSIEADGQRGREADGKTTKLLRNGNIYLINGGRVYNVLGVEE